MNQDFSTTFSINDQISAPLTDIIKRLDRLEEMTSSVRKSFEGLEDSNFKDLNSSLNSVTDEINKIDKNTGSLKKSLDSTAGIKAFSNVTKDVNDLNQTLNRTSQETQELNKTSFTSLSKNVDKISQQVSEIGSEATESAVSLKRINGSNINDVASAAKKASDAVDELGDEGQETGNQLSGIADKIGGITAAIGGVVATYASVEGVKKALDWSDTISQTTSRLNLVNQSFNEINGSQQTTAELQNKIFQAAQASRGSYSDLQNLVASLGNNAKDAFSSTDEMVKFATNLNKTFAISGASAEEMSNATLQLTQGLAAGALRGDELNSVLENAPELINVIANSMGVSRGEIRDLAAEGQITAEVVKNALINSSDAINEKFQSMDVTFSQLWTQFTNTAQHSFQPVAQELSKLASSGEFQASMENLGNAVAELAPSIADIVSKIASIAPQGLDLFVNGLKWVLDNAGAVSAGIIAISAATKAIKFGDEHSEEIGKFVEGLKKKLQSSSETFNTWGQQATKATSNLAAGFTKIIPDSLIAKTNQAKTGLLNMAATASTAVTSKFNVLTSGISNFASSIVGSITNTKLFTQVLSPMGNILGSAASGMLALLKPLLSFGGVAGIVVAGVGLVAAALGVFNQGGNLSAGINAFFTNFTKSASDFGVMAVRAINTFSAKIPELLPELIQRGIELVNSLIRGISTALPTIMQTAVSILSALVQGIANNLPLIVQGGIDFLSGLINAISTNLPMLMQSGIDIISQLLSSITANLPRIIDAGVQTLNNLINGIVANLPIIIQTGLQLIIALINGLVQNLPQIIEAGITLVTSLIDGLLQATPAILSGAWQIITTLGQALWDNRVAIWNTLVELGSNIVEGIKQGLIAAWDEITGWIGEKFNGLIDWVKSIFGIASPSTVFAEIGSNLLQGFWNGLKSVWEGLSSWLGGIWDKITNLFSGGGEQDESVVDYTATIESTKAQIQELQAVVSQGFSNILNQIQAIMGQIVAQTIVQFKVLTKAVLDQISQLVAQTKAKILEITGSFSSVFAALIAITTSALESMKAKTLAQVAEMIAKMGSTASGLNTIFLNAFKVMSTGTIQILESLNKGSIAVLESLSKSAVAIMLTVQSNMVTIVTKMSESVINSYTYLRTQAVSLVSAMATGLISIYQNLVNSVTTLIARMCNSIVGLVQNLVKSLDATIGVLPKHFSSIGQQMMVSMAQGIEFRKNDVTTAAGTLVQQLKDTFEKGLGIHSPSDYMIWVGQMMLAGLMQGMSPDQVQKFIDSIIGDMQTSFGNGSFNASETVDFLSENGTLELIGRVTGMDLSNVPQNMSIPGIIQAATQNIGYISPGGNYNSKFGLQYGNSEAWCASFVRAMAEQAGVNFPASNYVPDIREWAINNGRWTQTPQAGYAVIFDYSGSGRGSHIGLVESVQGPGNITTIEGNTSGPQGVGVYRKNRSSNILGYVALDGGHGVGSSLQSALQNAYDMKYHPERLMATGGAAGGVGIVPNVGEIGYPLPSIVGITSLYGYRIHPVFGVGRGHAGIDLGAPFGMPILSAMSGVVKSAGVNGGYGNAVIVSSGGLDILYGHMSQITTTQGARVNRGQQLGLVGSTGWSTGPHLHFEMRSGGGTIDPLDYLIAAGQSYDVGTRYVPQDMMAVIHKGEAILPAGQNPYSDSGGNYLSDIANRMVDATPNEAAGIMTPNDTGATVVSVGDFTVNVYVQGTNASPQEIAEAVKEEIWDDLRVSLAVKSGV